MKHRTTAAALTLLLAASTAAQAQPPPEPPPAPPPPAEEKKPEAPPTPKAEDTKEPKAGETKPPEAVAAGEADAGTTPESADVEGPPQPPIASDEERPEPDYDGRGDDPVTAGDVFIWIPRGLFFPIYLLAEYGIRWPLGKAVIAVEEADIPKQLVGFFTFGPGGKSGLVPSFLIDFGLRPSIGLYFFSDDTLWDGSTILSHLAFGGIDWYRATLALRHRIDEDGVDSYAKFVQAKFAYSHRPDWPFFGIGPDSNKDLETGYTAQFIDGLAVYDGGFWRSSNVRVEAGVRDAVFKDKTTGGELTLPQGVLNGWYPLPAHFNDGYFIFHGGINGALDTRERRNIYEGDASDHVSPPATGIKIGARARIGAGLRESEIDVGGVTSSERPLFVSYGGTLGGFVDIFNQRVIGLQATADFVDPIGDSTEVPFFELISLGGSKPLRGFLDRRLVGRSAVTAQLEYRWPIWVYLDGTVHYGVGNVFNEHLDGFELKKLHQSVGFGFRGVGSHDHAFELLVAFGLKRFEELGEGDDIDTVRFVFGATEGF